MLVLSFLVDYRPSAGFHSFNQIHPIKDVLERLYERAKIAGDIVHLEVIFFNHG